MSVISEQILFCIHLNLKLRRFKIVIAFLILILLSNLIIFYIFILFVLFYYILFKYIGLIKYE